MSEWSGEGMPPVGCACEYRDLLNANSQWRKCEILAHRGGGVVYWDLAGEYAGHFADLRSFRTMRAREDGLAPYSVDTLPLNMTVRLKKRTGIYYQINFFNEEHVLMQTADGDIIESYTHLFDHYVQVVEDNGVRAEIPCGMKKQ